MNKREFKQIINKTENELKKVLIQDEGDGLNFTCNCLSYFTTGLTYEDSSEDSSLRGLFNKLYGCPDFSDAFEDQVDIRRKNLDKRLLLLRWFELEVIEDKLYKGL